MNNVQQAGSRGPIGGDPPVDLEPVVVRDEPGLRLTAIPTGWVQVRARHREYGGPWPFRFPAIAVDGRWAAWLPVVVVLIQTPAQTLLVDTGEAVHQPPGHFGRGDRVQEAVYRRYLRMPVRPGRDAPARLRSLGTDPDEVDIIVLTHLHGDHTGALPAFPRARVLVGAQELTGYPGAITARLRDRRLVQDPFTDGPTAVSTTSLALVDDGSVRAVPLPGHTPGHLGVHVAGSTPVVVAGDAALDMEQLRRMGTPGIAADRGANRRTQQALLDIGQAGGQVLLSHDLPVPAE
jgi:glyoxylase-like metal-dependent hydrolase (beta-lactamase superfamily II)